MALGVSDMTSAEMGMDTAGGDGQGTVNLTLSPALNGRNRLTTGFRAILAIPHEILVGGPGWSNSNGVLGTVAAVAAFISWFAILFTGKQPQGLWDLEYFYLRWRVRAVSYLMLLRDEYPPFGDGEYPVSVDLTAPTAARDRVRVAFRLILAIPHIIVLAVLALAWGITTVVAWFAILFTGNYPAGLANFGVGVMRWGVRVEAYLLLLYDAYPPFSLSQ